MDISSTSNSSYNRNITPSKNSSDRQSNDEVQMVETKAKDKPQQRQAVQEDQQRYKDDNERRLDGRLITFGYQENDQHKQENNASVNRSRVTEAYSPPKNETSNSERKDRQNESSKDQEAIDIVV